MMTKPLHILIVNAHSVANAGDHVLLAVTIDELRRVFPDSRISVAMNDPAPIPGHAEVGVLPSLTTWFKQGAGGQGAWRLLPLLLLPVIAVQIAAFVSARRLGIDATGLLFPEQRALMQTYGNVDLVVSSAGNFLYTNGRVGLPLMLAFGAIFLGLALDTPVYTMPQTIGPLDGNGFAGWWQSAALRALAGGVRVLQVRDESSLAVLRAAQVPPDRTVVSPDVALLFGAQEPGMRQAHRPPRLGITLVNWQAQSSYFATQTAYEQAVAIAARWFVEAQGGLVYLFAQVTGPLAADDDRVPARRVAAQLADLSASVVCLDMTLPAATLKLGYGQMDIFLGTRLHSTLFALCEHTPVAAIAYQPKTRGVFTMLGLNDWVLDIDDAREGAVQALVERLWQARASVGDQIVAQMPHLRGEAERAAERIRDDYFAWHKEQSA